VTIGRVVAADEPVAYGEAVRAWARSTWEAYAALHATAREWIAVAQTSPSARRTPLAR
jgi:hypothetical protein